VDNSPTSIWHPPFSPSRRCSTCMLLNTNGRREKNLGGHGGAAAMARVLHREPVKKGTYWRVR
jgi:hypothetical protein